jgi:hypothetical protein
MPETDRSPHRYVPRFRFQPSEPDAPRHLVATNAALTGAKPTLVGMRRTATILVALLLLSMSLSLLGEGLACSASDASGHMHPPPSDRDGGGDGGGGLANAEMGTRAKPGAHLSRCPILAAGADTPFLLRLRGAGGDERAWRRRTGWKPVRDTSTLLKPILGGLNEEIPDMMLRGPHAQIDFVYDRERWEENRASLAGKRRHADTGVWDEPKRGRELFENDAWDQSSLGPDKFKLYQRSATDEDRARRILPGSKQYAMCVRLWSACRFGLEEEIVPALRAGANIHMRDQDCERWDDEEGPTPYDKEELEGCTAVHWAAYGDEPQCIDTLTQCGAHVDAETVAGWTALDVAASLGNTRACLALIRNGAGVCVRVCVCVFVCVCARVRPLNCTICCFASCMSVSAVSHPLRLACHVASTLYACVCVCVMTVVLRILACHLSTPNPRPQTHVRFCRFASTTSCMPCCITYPRMPSLNPKPQTPNPKPQTPNPKPQTPNPQKT